MAIQIKSFAFHKTVAKSISQNMEAAYALKFLGNENERAGAVKALETLSQQFDQNVAFGLRAIDAQIVELDVISEIETLTDDAKKAADKLKEALATVRRINSAVNKVTQVLEKLATIVV